MSSCLMSSFGIEMKPMLAALLLRPGVPGERQRLQTSVGECDQILLQRIDAERVFDLEHGELAVRPVGLDQKFAVAAEEARGHAVIIERRAGKIAQHRPIGRVSHGVAVLRRVPQTGFGRVALRARFAADEGRSGRLAGFPSDLAVIESVESEAARGDDGGGGRGPDPDFAPRGKQTRLRACAGAAAAGLLRVVSGRRCCVACVSTSLPAPLAPPMRRRKCASNRSSC